MKNQYKQVFVLEKPEADFICAVCNWIEENDGRRFQPEEILEVLIRRYAKDLGKDITKEIWHQALKDGRGPWR